jgi:hypothetical protein
VQFVEKQWEMYVLRNWEKVEGVRNSKMFAFLGAIAKFREVTISVVMSVRLSALGSYWTVYHEILYFSIFFFKSV